MAIKISGNTIIDDSRNIIDAVDVQTTTINDGPLAGFRNAIINGNFDVWQRGSGATTGSGYKADRWVVGGVAQTTTSRQAFSLGSGIPGEPEFFLRLNQAAGGSPGVVELSQRIEGVRTFAGQEITLSYWAKCDVANPWDGLRIVQEFGTGGTPSSKVNTIRSGPTLTSSWQKFTQTLTLPSISGKTIGTDGNDNLMLNFRFVRDVAFTFDLASVQLELGPVATPFERRPLGAELALCQRYCYFIPNSISRPIGFGREFGTTSVLTGFPTPVPMRATPTVSGGSFYLRCNGKQVSNASFTVGDVHGAWIHGSFPSSGIFVQGDVVVVGNASDVTFDSEL